MQNHAANVEISAWQLWEGNTVADGSLPYSSPAQHGPESPPPAWVLARLHSRPAGAGCVGRPISQMGKCRHRAPQPPVAGPGPRARHSASLPPRRGMIVRPAGPLDMGCRTHSCGDRQPRSGQFSGEAQLLDKVGPHQAGGAGGGALGVQIAV